MVRNSCTFLGLVIIKVFLDLSILILLRTDFASFGSIYHDCRKHFKLKKIYYTLQKNELFYCKKECLS